MDYKLLAPAINKYKNEFGGIIPILQEAQGIYGYIPTGLIKHISDETGINPSKIEGISSFYAQFRRTSAGKYMIMLCQGTACHVCGSGEIFDAIKAELNTDEGITTEDGLFTLTSVACIGCCSLAPAMMINGEVHGNLTPDSAVKIIERIRETEGGR